MVGDDATTDELTVRVPRYRVEGEVVEWAEYDMVWLAGIVHSEAVHQEVVEEYLHEPGVELIERGRGPRTVRGYAMETVSVLVTDTATVERLDLPDHVEGVPLVVEVGSIVDTG